ncbi:SPT2 chromatin protein [Ceratocystis platani]|uniref:SPT2 chromatin protein n=2 Tax=Ceratocystis TaxID=5157 RepID=A0A0F8D2L6_CERFI|nr:SPT2 chromatin protein [Ceratocystis platani]
MGQVGKIQHKKVEKGLSKKERTEQMERLKSEQKATSAKKMAASRTSKVRGGTVTDVNNRKATSAAPSKSRKAPEPEKKTRKPPPSTGYTGTARPSAPSKLKKHTPGGALLETSSYSRSSSAARYEEEDEDMDGFIDDQEEEEDPEDNIRYGRRYVYDDYDSDGSSDMEVGLNEIDHEEAIAERIARQDDRLEEERERARKAEKERRKREMIRRR